MPSNVPVPPTSRMVVRWLKIKKTNVFYETGMALQEQQFKCLKSGILFIYLDLYYECNFSFPSHGRSKLLWDEWGGKIKWNGMAFQKRRLAEFHGTFSRESLCYRPIRQMSQHQGSAVWDWKQRALFLTGPPLPCCQHQLLAAPFYQDLILWWTPTLLHSPALLPDARSTEAELKGPLLEYPSTGMPVPTFPYSELCMAPQHLCSTVVSVLVCPCIPDKVYQLCHCGNSSQNHGSATRQVHSLALHGSMEWICDNNQPQIKAFHRA